MSAPRRTPPAARKIQPTSPWVAAPLKRYRASARQKGQSVVEFGLVVVLFVLLISGMIDFGISLNARLSISSLSRVLVRAAAEGASDSELAALANGQGHIIGVTTAPYGGKYCCDSSSAITVTKTFCNQTPTASCTVKLSGQPGDRIVLNVTANGLEVITALARPAFGCNGTQTHCLTPISVQTTMRIEPTYP